MQAFQAPAKLNLFLHVVGRRPDGYHLLQSVFRLLDYGDTVHLSPRQDGVIRRVKEVEGVPENTDLAIRAATVLQQATGSRLGADIAIQKRIPMGGGLGGGSSDAATVLLALNRLWNLNLPSQRLIELGLKLGADVPFLFSAAMHGSKVSGKSCMRLRSNPLAMPYSPLRYTFRPLRCLPRRI